MSRRRHIKEAVIDILTLCMLCLLIAWGFFNQGEVMRYSPVSLRYDAPISGKAAYAARQYSILHGNDDMFWPTFWREHKSEFITGFSSADADCIAYSGDASLVWPFEYVTGSAPGVTDGAGCVVSESLARRIWGSVDITGMTVEVDGVARTIRGVFRGSADLALISFRDDDTSRSWTAVELSGGPVDPSRGDAESYAITSGLGRPDTILTGRHITFARTLALLPLLIPAAYTLALTGRLIRKRWPESFRNILFIGIAALACLLPALVNVLPASMVPTRWSDFSFWASLLRDSLDGLREFLNAAPRLRDADLKLLLLKQSGLAIVSVCAAAVLCFRWRPERSLS